jgi:hypothetical protein
MPHILRAKFRLLCGIPMTRQARASRKKCPDAARSPPVHADRKISSGKHQPRSRRHRDKSARRPELDGSKKNPAMPAGFSSRIVSEN